jgi:catechol 2,3-dioxygenase
MNPPTPLPNSTHIDSAVFKVADLKRSVHFYREVVGMEVMEQGQSEARLGAGERTILTLEEVPGANRQPANTTGLYHAAILFPDRATLARKVAQLSAAHFPFGYADHLVSEAFYLSDPDGNGLELYRDRAPEEWPRVDGKIVMDNAPIDFKEFFSSVDPNDPHLADPLAPAGTRLGHMHLRVADLRLAREFYIEQFGFDLVTTYPGALFVSAGGYHHHLGLNVWESRGGKPPQEPSAGLRRFSVALPDEAAIEGLAERLEGCGVKVEEGFIVKDPFENEIRLVKSQA